MLSGDCISGSSLRFTPTRVGNARRLGSCSKAHKVHPHAGGECRLFVQQADRGEGSPPRGWGMPLVNTFPNAALRFTPTRVGNAPRVLNRHLSPSGSPPRGWGMPWNCARWQPCLRFTPTRVGNAASVLSNVKHWMVHPHAGGECVGGIGRYEQSTGSPPRGWGMRKWNLPGHFMHRFTPTRVGNADAGVANAKSTEVHPHAGGECVADE